jgi:tRNA uracil 4-sulfurtransferase
MRIDIVSSSGKMYYWRDISFTVSLLLIRYAEMGLKSRPVRKRFESILVGNMLDSLASRGIESLVSTEHGRIFVRADQEESALDVISRTFGVASVSPVVECRADLDEIGAVAAEISRPLIGRGDSFAVRARREGVHSFTSMDVNREVGSAIHRANEDKEVSVDLQHPTVEIFVEVRSSRAFVFHRVIPGPGGLPLGSQGKVLAFVSRRRDILAAWLMMKRGCRVAVITENPSLVTELASWEVNLRVEAPSNLRYMMDRWGALATVHGHVFEEVDPVLKMEHTPPAFFPLIGMDEREITERLATL